jgi:hypothetical protein
MGLGYHLQQKLSKRYEPSAMLNMHYKGNDLSVKTDDEGNPILLFIGRADDSGKIKGERYVRTLKRNTDGVIVKDHWDLKGKVG